MHPRTILIYEDNDEIRRICELILENEYLDVQAFNSCENLFEDIEKVEPD
jgi:DNA-binding NtrC family response regulator